MSRTLSKTGESLTQEDMTINNCYGVIIEIVRSAGRSANAAAITWTKWQGLDYDWSYYRHGVAPDCEKRSFKVIGIPTKSMRSRKELLSRP